MGQDGGTTVDSDDVVVYVFGNEKEDSHVHRPIYVYTLPCVNRIMSYMMY